VFGLSVWSRSLGSRSLGSRSRRSRARRSRGRPRFEGYIMSGERRGKASRIQRRQILARVSGQSSATGATVPRLEMPRTGGARTNSSADPLKCCAPPWHPGFGPTTALDGGRAACAPVASGAASAQNSRGFGPTTALDGGRAGCAPVASGQPAHRIAGSKPASEGATPPLANHDIARIRRSPKAQIASGLVFSRRTTRLLSAFT